MKAKFVRAFLAGLCLTSLVFGSSLQSYASNVQDVEIGRDEYVDIRSDGSSEGSANGVGNQNTSSSQSSSQQGTSAEINAYDAKQSARGLISSAVEDARKDAEGHIYGAGTEGNNMAGIGFSKVSESGIENLLDSVNKYQGYLGKDNVDAYYNNQSVENGMLPLKTLPEDDSVKTLTAEEKKMIKQEIAKNEGFEPSNSAGARFNMTGTGGKEFSMGYTGGDPMFYFDGAFENPGSPQWTDIRPDLFGGGGLNDFYTWDSRFNQLGRFTSNAMEDYCNLAYLINYHIAKVNKNYITNVVYGDKRYWSIYQANEGDTEPVGDPIKTVELDNAEHTYRFQGFDPGTYLVVPEQEAEYDQSTYVNYDVVEYMFDAETKTILYFNEKTVSNGKGGSVMTDSKHQNGRLKTGDVFRITVNDLGEVVKDGSATERIE